MFSMPSARALLSGAAFVFVAACSNGEASQQPQQEAAANQPAATQPAAEKTVTPIFAAQTANADLPVAVVYKSPTCGCCNAWVEHMKENGFRVEAHDTSDVNPIKDAGHVPQDGRSCHTAQIGKYVIEGHVPADQIKKLLAENPSDIAGLTVPGMVTGSPGMEGPNPQHYDILAFTHDGKTRVYASR
ncbi:MAG TPA: DUF411 domain-containing protein [Longimicrobium sp.]|nr:DUF411 domain-containing protein [Longimicrobium sp.]